MHASRTLNPSMRTPNKHSAHVCARLRAGNALLFEALKRTIEAQWMPDSHAVSFDSTVIFGPGYNFSGMESTAREEFRDEYECVVWPSGGLGPAKWSAYCTYEGSMWFEQFDTAEEAKEVCMRLLDTVIPNHPAMQARAAIKAAAEFIQPPPTGESSVVTRDDTLNGENDSLEEALAREQLSPQLSVTLRRRLIKIHDALCNQLGDTDPYIDDAMTDAEICEEMPIHWAAKEIADLIGDSSWDQDPSSLASKLHPASNDLQPPKGNAMTTPMSTQTTLELIESAITSIEDGWTKSALETLKEAQLQEKAREQLLNAGVAPEPMKYLVDTLKLAVRQNSSDMLMTGEELRQCEAAIAKATGEQK